jgi:hypothetical protein
MFHGGGYEVPPAFTLICCSAYSTLKVEAMFSSETRSDFQRAPWFYIPEDFTLHDYEISGSKMQKMSCSVE